MYRLYFVRKKITGFLSIVITKKIINKGYFLGHFFGFFLTIFVQFVLSSLYTPPFHGYFHGILYGFYTSFPRVFHGFSTGFPRVLHEFFTGGHRFYTSFARTFSQGITFPRAFSRVLHLPEASLPLFRVRTGLEQRKYGSVRDYKSTFSGSVRDYKKQRLEQRKCQM